MAASRSKKKSGHFAKSPFADTHVIMTGRTRLNNGPIIDWLCATLSNCHQITHSKKDVPLRVRLRHTRSKEPSLWWNTKVSISPCNYHYSVATFEPFRCHYQVWWVQKVVSINGIYVSLAENVFDKSLSLKGIIVHCIAICNNAAILSIKVLLFGNTLYELETGYSQISMPSPMLRPNLSLPEWVSAMFQTRPHSAALLRSFSWSHCSATHPRITARYVLPSRSAQWLGPWYSVRFKKFQSGQ